LTFTLFAAQTATLPQAGEWSCGRRSV